MIPPTCVHCARAAQLQEQTRAARTRYLWPYSCPNTPFVRGSRIICELLASQHVAQTSDIRSAVVVVRQESMDELSDSASDFDSAAEIEDNDHATSVDEICEKCRHVKIKKPSDLHLKFSPLDRDHLESVISEWEEILSNIERAATARKIDCQRLKQGEIEPALQYFLSDIIGHFLGHANNVAARQGTKLFRRKDVLAFIKLELMTCIYQETPTSLYAHEGGAAMDACDKATYFRLLHALQQPHDKNHIA